jgi:hypothetical protein
VIKKRRARRTARDFYDRCRVYYLLHLYRLGNATEKPLRGDAYVEAAEAIGVSASQAYKLVHFWSIIGDIVAFANVQANEHSRRSGERVFPTDEDLINQFPKLGKTRAKSAGSKADADEIEEGARNRSTAQIRKDELSLRDELIQQRQAREDAERKLQIAAERAAEREAQLRRARDDAITWAEKLQAELERVKAELAAAQVADPVNNNHSPDPVPPPDDPPLDDPPIDPDDEPQPPPSDGGGDGGCPAEPDMPEPESVTKPEQPEPKFDWASLDAAGAAILAKARSLDSDFPELDAACLDLEESELGLKRAGRPFADDEKNLVARRLRVVTIRVATLLGKPTNNISGKARKWWYEHQSLQLGRIIELDGLV